MLELPYLLRRAGTMMITTILTSYGINRAANRRSRDNYTTGNLATATGPLTRRFLLFLLLRINLHGVSGSLLLDIRHRQNNLLIRFD